MALDFTIKVSGADAWRLDHHLPILWPWLFDPGAITESRRLHSTVFDGAERFRTRAALASRLEEFAPLMAAFEEVRPDLFPRALGVKPDEVISLDLGELERRRPYNHEDASTAWEDFFQACQGDDLKRALAAWEKATLSPLVFTGGKQRDAIALAAIATGMGHDTTSLGRTTVLSHLLFGKPVTRPAMALSHVWRERLENFPPARFTGKVGPMRGVLRRLFPGGSD